MVSQKTFFLLIFALQSLCHASLVEQFERRGYVEICDQKRIDSLYAHFDALIECLQTNPVLTHKLYSAKERFIRLRERDYYSTDFFGFYDESKSLGRGQISFYYSSYFHEWIRSRYPELNRVAEITRFLEACFEVQKRYEDLFVNAAAELGVETLFDSEYGKVPILFKVVKYLPSYIAARPHYDGTAFSLFLDSTDNESLLLSPYKSTFGIEDFSTPQRDFPRGESILLIPGTLLAEFGIYPTTLLKKPNAPLSPILDLEYFIITK